MPPFFLSKLPSFSEICTGFPFKHTWWPKVFSHFLLLWGSSGCTNYLALCLEQSSVKPARNGKLEDFILLWEKIAHALNGDVAKVQEGPTCQFIIPSQDTACQLCPCPPARHKGYSGVAAGLGTMAVRIRAF